ncbi:hypothetical protein KJ359_010401 [Pestalotiopsis sp. 9143b]|nr:hypothetical protein KJ359_010401 [Pestalotiopsis sp. 9143b]
MSLANGEYRDMILYSLHDRADHYRARWNGTLSSATPWRACSTRERYHLDAPDDAEAKYHFDQEFVVSFMKLYSPAALVNQELSNSGWDLFCDTVEEERSFDMEKIVTPERMQAVLLSYMAGLDHVFFNGVFTVPERSDPTKTTAAGAEDEEPRSILGKGWTPCREPLVNVEAYLSPGPGSDAARFDASSNTIHVWCQNREGKAYNLERLIVMLAHEMTHAYLHIFAYETGSVTRNPHGGEFWAGIEFIYSRLWTGLVFASGSETFGYVAATARQHRRDSIGDTEFAGLGLSPSFFRGMSCPLQSGLTYAAVEAMNIAKMDD